MSSKLIAKAAFPAKIFLLVFLLAVAVVARKEQHGFENLQKNRTAAALLAPPTQLPFPDINGQPAGPALVQ
jgi:hypothetical protein